MTPRYVLSSGKSIPALGFGTYAVRPAKDVVYKALKIGYRLFDSAVMYHNEREVALGIKKWLDENPLENKREDVVYTTKLLDSQQGYEIAKKAIKDSMNKVAELDYIDIILIHSPQTCKSDRLGTWKALQEAVDEGIVKSIGVSNFGIHHLRELLEWDGLKYPPVINQIELSPWLQRRDIVKFCKDYNIQVEAYSPLTQGYMLKDKTLVQLSRKYEKTPAQILIRWSIQSGFIPLPRTSNITRLAPNFEAQGFELTDEDYDSLGDRNAYRVFDWDPTVYTG